MAEIIFRHRRLPCVFVWNDPEANWDRVRELLIKEIQEKGFEDFVKVEPKNEDDRSVHRKV